MTIDDKSPCLLPCVKTDFSTQTSGTEVWYKRRDIATVHILYFFRRDRPRYAIGIDRSAVELLGYFHAGSWTAEIRESVDDRLGPLPPGNIPDENRRTGTKALRVGTDLEPMQDLARHLQVGRDGTADQTRKPRTRCRKYLIGFVVSGRRPAPRGPERIGGCLYCELDAAAGSRLETDRFGIHLNVRAMRFREHQLRPNAPFGEHISAPQIQQGRIGRLHLKSRKTARYFCA